MQNPDFDQAHAEARKIHGAHLNELIKLGIYGLLALHADYNQIGGNGMTIDSGFNGESIVRLKASRSKQEQEVSYKEEVYLTYDGTILYINGAHPIFSGQIPTKEKLRNKVIGDAIKEAFSNPKRTIITDFNPRDYY